MPPRRVPERAEVQATRRGQDHHEMPASLLRDGHDLHDLAFRDMAFGRDLAGREDLAMRQRVVMSVLPIEVLLESIIHRHDILLHLEKNSCAVRSSPTPSVRI
jgi:hypothetical protein